MRVWVCVWGWVEGACVWDEEGSGTKSRRWQFWVDLQWVEGPVMSLGQGIDQQQKGRGWGPGPLHVAQSLGTGTI